MSVKESRFFNRELSWLAFNDRVLNKAADRELPLLEQLKFLAISASNLDEFFMVRVGGLQLLERAGDERQDISGLTAHQQLKRIHAVIAEMTHRQDECANRLLNQELSARGIVRTEFHADSQNQHQRKSLQRLERYFEETILSVMTPIMVESTEDFPRLRTLEIAVCLRLQPSPDAPDDARFAVIPLGDTLERFVTVPAETGYTYLLLEDVVGLFAQRFFPHEQVLECVPFRVTRNADLEFSEDMASDLLQEMTEIIYARQESHFCRVEISSAATHMVKEFLKGHLAVEDHQVIEFSGPLGLSDFMRLVGLQGFNELRSSSPPPQLSPDIDLRESLFETISERDVLLLHPYEAYDPVVKFIEDAADDPNVLSIKQTLYRTSRNSPIVRALKRAAESGKYVTAVVELKARFDESRNIDWAKHLERAGVHVIYGIKRYKVHAKVCLVTRREPSGVKRYMHLGTGNYNESTAKLYTDVSLFTSNPDFGVDVAHLFNAMTGQSQPQRFLKLAAAPFTLREKLIELIEVEKTLAEQGRPAFLRAKLNSLADPGLIEALYEASQAGVRIDLNIRGICCLRPAMAGLSDNIRVVSIIDQFLEHARIVHAHHDGEDQILISSADWMPRNLDRRVELLVPVVDPICRARVLEMLNAGLRDTAHAEQLLADLSYKAVQPEDGEPEFDSQEFLTERAKERMKASQQQLRNQLQPFEPVDS